MQSDLDNVLSVYGDSTDALYPERGVSSYDDEPIVPTEVRLVHCSPLRTSLNRVLAGGGSIRIEYDTRNSSSTCTGSIRTSPSMSVVKFSRAEDGTWIPC